MFYPVLLLQTLAAGPQWPPTDFLVKQLASQVQGILDSQDPATGRFGTQPWICTDQNVLLPLAVAWATEHPDNPWYHDAKVLTAIMAGGDALVDDQDAKGMWIFRKKDNSTWGQIHMPWTYSRWVRAYDLIRDVMPADRRAKWEQGLRLGFTGIRKYMDGKPHNIPCHHAMALAIAGRVFNEPDWRAGAELMMHKVIEEQDPAGFWSENFGPVVGYNKVYIDALGVYYAETKDPLALDALTRAAKFHAAVLWSDGSEVACIDERQIYHDRRDIGNVGFSWTPEGRGYLVSQVTPFIVNGTAVNADYCASMLRYGSTGEVILPGSAVARSRTVIGDNGAVIERQAPWQWAFSAYATPVPTSRWIQDRQNLVDIFHDELGLVAGGGNTKLQPNWSTFTVGDPSLVKHTPGDESPKFDPDVHLLWVPSKADLDLPADGPPSLLTTYGETATKVTITIEPKDVLAVTYHAEPQGKPVEAHLPLLWRSGRITTATGQRFYVAEDEVLLSAADVGDWLLWDGLKVGLPAGATIRWPALQHNPYTKDGRSKLTDAKLVICLPMTGQNVTVRLSAEPEPKFEGLAFRAIDLPSAVSEGSSTKPLPDLDCMFIGAKQPGEWIEFTLPEVPAGKYQLLAETVLAYSYGIVQASVDGQNVGQPFDAWCPAVDAEGERFSLGAITLGPGEHRVRFTIVGKHEGAKGQYIGVKGVLLAPGK